MIDISNIWKFDLRKGNSPHPLEGACLLDAVSWFEYGKLDDHPQCVCPVIAAFGRGINDALSDADRQRLKIFIPRLPGSVDPTAEVKRAEYLAWQAVRVFSPLTLNARGLHQEARRLQEFTGTLGEAAYAVASAARIGQADRANARADARADPYAAIYTANAATNSLYAAAYAATSAADAASYTARAASRAADAISYAATSGAARAASRAAARAAVAVDAADAAHAATHADAVALAAPSKVTDAMIAAMEGVLAIGKQAPGISPERLFEAQRTFELARV